MTTFAHKIFLEKEFRHPIERVFKAFHTPDMLKRWWGPRNCTIGTVELDFRVAGQYRIQLIRPNGYPFFVFGQFEDIILNEKISYSYFYEGLNPPPFQNSRVTIRFHAPSEHLTTVRLTQEFTEQIAQREAREQAWHIMMARLERVL